MPRGKSKHDEINDLLQRAAKKAGGRVIVKTNKDGTVDGELAAPLERGKSAEEFLESVEEEVRRSKVNRASFSTGFRWEPSEDARDAAAEKRETKGKGGYDRFRGLFQVFSSYYDDLQSSVATTESILANMKKRRFRKPAQIIVRVHWNKHGRKPERGSRK